MLLISRDHKSSDNIWALMQDAFAFALFFNDRE
jgi:hypothetical protein